MLPYSLLALAAVTAMIFPLGSAAAAAVDVTVTPLQPTVARGENVLVRVTLSNTSPTAQHLLR